MNEGSMTLSGINSLNLLLGFVEKVTALTGVCSFFQISREEIDLPHGFNPYLLELNIFLRKVNLVQDLDCLFDGHGDRFAIQSSRGEQGSFSQFSYGYFNIFDEEGFH
ncbi:hypothetical protein OAH08_00210 [Verrucomicrobia bacterium]|nr:hypothetical protein [Verrucomicrobiota bacterium]